MNEYYHIFVNVEGKKTFEAEELSTDNMQCYCDKMVEEKGNSVAKNLAINYTL